MKPILAVLIVAATLDASAETARLGAAHSRANYSGSLSCVLHEPRSPSVHIFQCRDTKGCELPAAQPISNLLQKFSSTKIVKLAPLPNGCLRITLIGKLKLPDAPPWAGTAYPGWRPFTDTP